MPDFADVPTFKELGYPDLVSTTWFALSGPPGLPNDIVTKVNRDVVNTMSRPEIQQRMRQDGMVIDPLTPTELRDLIVRETATFRPVIEKAGMVEK